MAPLSQRLKCTSVFFFFFLNHVSKLETPLIIADEVTWLYKIKNLSWWMLSLIFMSKLWWMTIMAGVFISREIRFALGQNKIQLNPKLSAWNWLKLLVCRHAYEKPSCLEINGIVSQRRRREDDLDSTRNFSLFDVARTGVVSILGRTFREPLKGNKGWWFLGRKSREREKSSCLKSFRTLQKCVFIYFNSATHCINSRSRMLVTGGAAGKGRISHVLQCKDGQFLFKKPFQ